MQLKVGCVIFQKRFRKPSRGRVPKQICSQSAVRFVSTRDVVERASGRKIAMVDKQQDENVCGAISQEVGPV